MIINNQATLIYSGNTITSNVTTGEVVSALTLTKIASVDFYLPESQFEYTITIENGSRNSFTGLSLSDDLGMYRFMDSARFPLLYIEQSANINYYNSSGVNSGTVSVTQETNGINFTFDMPANTVALLRYKVQTTSFAPLTAGSVITNTAVLTGSIALAPLTVTHSLPIAVQAELVIAKNVSESSAIGQPLTFTFTVLNYGNKSVSENDYAIISDSLDPPLTGINVKANGTPWTEGVQYQYDENFFYFRTESGAILLDSATFTQDDFGSWITSPSSLIITITGTVASASS